MQIAVQPSYPPIDVLSYFLDIGSLHCCTLYIGKAVTIVRQLLAGNIGKYGQFLVLQEGVQHIFLSITIMIAERFVSLGQTMQEFVPVAFQRRKTVQPCTVCLKIYAERAFQFVCRSFYHHLVLLNYTVPISSIPSFCFQTLWIILMQPAYFFVQSNLQSNLYCSLFFCCFELKTLILIPPDYKSARTDIFS